MAPQDEPISVTTATPQANEEPEKQKQYASIIPDGDRRLELQHTISSISHDDMAHAELVVTGDLDEAYSKFSERRKIAIVATVSFCSFLAPISSTTVLSAVPEVAATFNTDGSIINISNALYMLFMGISPCFYGPYGNIYGRKWVCCVAHSSEAGRLLYLQTDIDLQVSVISAALFTAFSIGTALAPNLASFFVFRILTAFQGTAFLVVGSAVIGDIYKPVCVALPPAIDHELHCASSL